MAVAKPSKITFEEYLSYQDETDQRYELVDGELVALPPESELNNWLANHLFLLLATAQIVNPRLIRTHACEIQVPILESGDAANRYPDLVILREEHLVLTQRRLTITRDMPPPRLIVEVVSPGRSNRERDYQRKRSQYAAIAVPEYWLVDPELKTVTVLQLVKTAYQEVGVFQGQARLISPELDALNLTADQVLQS
ncbi:MAG TPA: Uma2 family endonuclease [Leptolyngbyaceae cyanobacterium M65_K2018_010]|nr:Uma2 family endonuclease [Leptolyngbyaceae cyanobacterium M65_K2018_010]